MKILKVMRELTMKLILATQSQFRINIYQKLGFDIESMPSLEKEYYFDRQDPIKYVEELSKIKADSVSQQLTSGIVIGCDTVAVIDGIILEKPKDISEVRKFMKLLQGRDNMAISGVTIVDVDKGISKTFNEITTVTFAKMNDEEIEWYISNVPNVLQCAGYSISKEGGRFVTKINGDYYNIFGAPVSRLYQELKNMNLIKIADDDKNIKHML